MAAVRRRPARPPRLGLGSRARVRVSGGAKAGAGLRWLCSPPPSSVFSAFLLWFPRLISFKLRTPLRVNIAC